MKTGNRFAPDPELAAFIQGLPKTETHLHLEGALPWELLVKLDPVTFRRPPASWQADYRFESFQQFEEELIAHAVQWFTSPERYAEAARIVFSLHLAQNVRYVETSFHSGICELLGIPGTEIVAAIRSAVPPNVEVRIFMGITRFGHTQSLLKILKESVGWEGLDGLDLHGVELHPFPDWLPDLYREARARGKFTKAHAGEFGGAEFVRRVVEDLGVNRVEHGVRAIEDDAVVQMLIGQEVTLDVCPTSNVKLGVVPSMRQHPIRNLFDAGVRCTVNTDDPFSFGNRLSDEFVALSQELGFSRRELVRIARNGWEIALLDEGVRRTQLHLLDAIEGTLECT